MPSAQVRAPAKLHPHRSAHHHVQRPEVVRESAFLRESGPSAECLRPAAAVSLVPKLTGVQAVITQAQVTRYYQQLQQAQKENITPVLLSFLERYEPTFLTQEGSPVEHLQAWLLTHHPLPVHEVQVKSEGGKLIFSFETYADGYYRLGHLHRALRRVDEHLLPGVFLQLERHCSSIVPTWGPSGMRQYAEYLWDLEYLAEQALPERLEHVQTSITERAALTIARRLGLPHAHVLQDTLPHVYFSIQDTITQTTRRLTRALKAHPQLAVVQALAPLVDLLPRLARLDARLPRMTDQECEQVDLLPPFCATLSPSLQPYCAVAETGDDFMKRHWEGGEHAPHYVLEVGRSRMSQERLIRALRLIPEICRVQEEILSTLDAAQRLLPGQQAS